MENSWTDCDTNLLSTCSAAYVISSATGATIFAIIDTNWYVPVVSLTTQDKTELLQNYYKNIYLE